MRKVLCSAPWEEPTEELSTRTKCASSLLEQALLPRSSLFSKAELVLFVHPARIAVFRAHRLFTNTRILGHRDFSSVLRTIFFCIENSAINTAFQQVKLSGQSLSPLKSSGWLISRNGAVPCGSRIKLKARLEVVGYL